MAKALSELAGVETEIRAILEASPNESFTLAQLATKLSQLTSDSVREALWNLYYRGQAEPIQPTPGDLPREQRWKVAEPQKNQLKNPQPMWQVTASGSVLGDWTGSQGNGPPKPLESDSR